MDQGKYLIEELCRLTGFSRRTVRYYVQEGLVDPPAGRGRGGYYSDLHVAQLARIRELQERGFRLDAIRSMVASRPPAETAEPAGPVRVDAVAPARAAEPAAAARLPAGFPRSSWVRHVVTPGVELHVSAEAASQLGPAVATALATLRSIVQHEGGLHG